MRFIVSDSDVEPDDDSLECCTCGALIYKGDEAEKLAPGDITCSRTCTKAWVEANVNPFGPCIDCGDLVDREPDGRCEHCSRAHWNPQNLSCFL